MPPMTQHHFINLQRVPHQPQPTSDQDISETHLLQGHQCFGLHQMSTNPLTEHLHFGAFADR